MQAHIQIRRALSGAYGRNPFRFDLFDGSGDMACVIDTICQNYTGNVTIGDVVIPHELIALAVAVHSDRVKRANARHDRKHTPSVLVFFAIGDVGEHSGFITSRVDADAWTGSNEGGWTYQSVTGAHGTILGEFATEVEARDCLDKWLECDDDRCYSHGTH